MKILSLDLGASYGQNTQGEIAKRLINNYGQPKLGQRLWEAGRQAVSTLEDCLVDKSKYQGPRQLAEMLPEGVRSGEEFLDETFLPLILDLAASGKLESNIGKINHTDFQEFWIKISFTSKVGLYCNYLGDIYPKLKRPVDLSFVTRRLVALAVLMLLDEVLIVDSLGDENLDVVISDIEKLISYLDGENNIFATIDAVKLQSRRETAQAGAAARHAEDRAIKQDVFSWLDENMPSFKSMDAAAAEIVKSVAPMKFRTVRDWVGEWKKLRSAGKP